MKRMRKTTIQLETLSCPSCLQKIEAAIATLPGIKSSKVGFNTSKVKATFDESVVQPADIASRIEALGYPVLSIKTR